MKGQAGLLDQILSGSNRNLQVLAAQGLVPLAQEELLPIQVALTGSPDAEIAEKAAAALKVVDVGLTSEFLKEHAGVRELQYFGTRVGNGALMEVVIRRPDVPRSILVEMASILTPELQEVLVLRQDAILDEPKILVGLESNPQISSYAKRRIWEYREHLLPRDKVPPKSAEEVQAEVDALTDEEMAEAIAEVKGKVEEQGIEDEVVDETHNLSPAEIRLLPPPMRIKLARNANRQLRQVLIRDANYLVAITVMTSNSLPDSEVEQIANSRTVCEEVLQEIPKRRDWIRKYAIARALVKNPKTNLATSLKLVPRMTVRDLRDLAKDKNIPDAVRTRALRLYQVKMN